jgi:hypothetical protein
MSSQRPIEDRLSQWFIEAAPGEIPDRVLEATFERTRASHQRSGLLGWRFQPMFTRVATAATVAAAVVVAALAIGTGRPVPDTVGSSPSPSVRSSDVPSPLPSGTETFRTRGWAVHYQEQEGLPLAGAGPDDIWFETPSAAVAGGILTSAVDPDSLFVSPGRIRFDRSVGTSVDEYLAWLQDHPRIDVTEPVDLTVGGWPAKRVDIELSEGQNYEQGNAPSRLGLAWFGGGSAAVGPSNGETHRFVLVDLGDATLLFTCFAQEPEDIWPTFDAFLESIYIGRDE